MRRSRLYILWYKAEPEAPVFVDVDRLPLTYLGALYKMQVQKFVGCPLKKIGAKNMQNLC